jgi:hypothetical protein
MSRYLDYPRIQLFSYCQVVGPTHVRGLHYFYFRVCIIYFYPYYQTCCSVKDRPDLFPQRLQFHRLSLGGKASLRTIGQDRLDEYTLAETAYPCYRCAHMGCGMNRNNIFNHYYLRRVPLM